MERLLTYDFTPPRRLSPIYAARTAFVEKLSDGHIWKFHKSEFPNSGLENVMPPKTVVVWIKNEITKDHPKWKIESKIEDDHIILRVNRIGGR